MLLAVWLYVVVVVHMINKEFELEACYIIKEVIYGYVVFNYFENLHIWYSTKCTCEMHTKLVFGCVGPTGTIK